MTPLDGGALGRDILARALAPDPVVAVDEWAERDRVVASESSPLPGPWRHSVAPYLVEPMRCLSPSHPARRVVIRKSAQTGFTEVGLNLIGHTVVVAPTSMLIVLPTLDEAKKYVRVKLGPAIDATPTLRSRVLAQTSRDESGSTTLLKRWPGGYAIVTGANSSAGLQMVSVQLVIREELTEWPLEIEGRGDPAEMAEARTDAYSSVCKILDISTPGVEGSCRITKGFEDGDQRYWHVRCPTCDGEQVLDWKGFHRDEKGEPTLPARYICQINGCVIEQKHKHAMVAQGRWIATKPGEGRHPSFSINALYSPFLSWDLVIRRWRKARNDPGKEKAFRQQVLGLAWRETGEAPDHEKLFARLDRTLERGRIPDGALIVTAGVDVQAHRLEWAVWGWGAGKTRWLIDAGIIVGDTADAATWAELDHLTTRLFVDHRGNRRPIEAGAVDSGYNTQAVYAWVRRHGPTWIAVKGQPGARHPPLGAPAKVDVSWEGRKLGSTLVWPVGSHGLKTELYGALRKLLSTGRDGWDGKWPVGVARLPGWLDEKYCAQLAAEQLVGNPQPNGLTTWTWVKARGIPNEALDNAVYAAAAAVHLGIDRLTREGWRMLAAQRGVASAELPERAAPADERMPMAIEPAPAARRRVGGIGRTVQ